MHICIKALNIVPFCACAAHSVVYNILLMVLCVIRHPETEAVSIWFDDCDAPASL